MLLINLVILIIKGLCKMISTILMAPVTTSEVFEEIRQKYNAFRNQVE